MPSKSLSSRPGLVFLVDLSFRFQWSTLRLCLLLLRLKNTSIPAAIKSSGTLVPTPIAVADRVMVDAPCKKLFKEAEAVGVITKVPGSRVNSTDPMSEALVAAAGAADGS